MFYHYLHIYKCSQVDAMKGNWVLLGGLYNALLTHSACTKDLQQQEEQRVQKQMVLPPTLPPLPPQGPDINNMESDWDYMKKQKQTRQPKSTEEPQQGLRDTQSHLTAAEPNTDLHF